MNNTNDTTGSINMTMPMDTCEISSKLRANFDHIHSRSSKFFAMKALDLENTFKNKTVPQTILDSHMSYISSSLICSVAELKVKGDVVSLLSSWGLHNNITTSPFIQFKKLLKNSIKELEKDVQNFS